MQLLRSSWYKIKNLKTKYLGVLMFLCFFVPISFAQEAQASNKNDNNILMDEAYSLRSANPKQAKSLLSQIDIQRLSPLQSDKHKYLIAYLHYREGNIDTAILEFEKLNTEQHSKNLRVQAQAALVSLYSGTQNWGEGFKVLNSLLSEQNTIEDTETLEQLHLAVINFYSQLNENELVENYTRPLRNGPFSERMLCLVSTTWTSSQLKLDASQVKESELLFDIQRCTDIKEEVMVYSLKGSLVIFYYKSGLIDKARSVLIENLPKVEQINYPPIAARFYEQSALVHMDTGEYNKAKTYAQKLLDESILRYSPTTTIAAYDILSRVAEKNQNYAEALEYYKHKYTANQRNMDEQNAKALAIQKAQRNIDEKLNEIALLDRQNSLLLSEKKLAKKDAQNRLLVAIIMLFAFIAVLAWAFVKRNSFLQLSQMAEIDDLTQIANRRHFTNQAQDILKRCEQVSAPVCLIMFDLDHFKSINDTHGHQTGDKALIATVAAARTSFRLHDLFGRIGGEEFGIILENCALEKAQLIAEDCRKAIEKAGSSISCERVSIALSASFGLAVAHHCAYDFDTLMANADDAMYKSKHNGRNQITVFN